MTPPLDRVNIERLKRDARRMSKASDLTHSQALEVQAKKFGYQTYAALRAAADTVSGYFTPKQ